ncbi:MAG TPA: hypothetical protein VF488_11985 [Gemmatimonadaceae bacterium]
MMAIDLHRPSRRIACGILVVLALTSACGADHALGTDPPGTLEPITIVSGFDQSDTVAARPAEPLVVEIRDSTSKRVVGATVQFKSIIDPLDPRRVPFVFVAPLTETAYTSLASDVTDSLGRARTLLTYGFEPGTARLEVSVPQLGVVDTLVFTAAHGAPARLSVAPADTSVAAGGTYQLRAIVSDQYFNPIAGLTPSFSATNVTVSPTGQVTVPNTVPLRAKIVVSYAALSDTAGVSVVPRFPMIIVRGGKIERINSDGSGSTTLAATPYAQLSPSSVPATSTVVFYEGYPGSDAKLFGVQPGGMPQLLISGSTSADAWPRLSPDGAWVYFVRNLTTLWRVKLDGTGLDSLASFTVFNNIQGYYSAPTISPDGRSVAIEDGAGVQIIDVATKATRTVPVTCGSPRYSPDGAFFACASPTDVSIVATDGTGQRVVAQFQNGEGPDHYSGVDWSPDGKWLVVMPPMWPALLIEVSSGTTVPLTGLGGQYSQPSFVR